MKTPGWLSEYLSKPEITDLLLNGPNEVYIDQGNGLEPQTPDPFWNEDELKSWVIEALSGVGKSWDAKHPFMDATLSSGHRLHVTFPPIAKKGILVSLRRLATPTHGKGRWHHSTHYSLLAEAVYRGDSILISGATGCGKTTLASDLLSEVPTHERMIALEDTPELNPQHPHFISLMSRAPNSDGCGEVTLRTLLRQSLRMRPDRIILGECRGPEVLDLLQALNTGHKGALATLHANSPRDALRRVELLCLLGGGGVLPLHAIRELLSYGIQWVVQVQREGGKREISEICRIEGREGDTILMRPVIEQQKVILRVKND